MSIRKGSSIIAGNIGQNVDSALSPTSDNPVKNSVIYDAFQNTLSSDSITNCITEIPQDIVLELSGTTLTLKAGSKMYYPNGFETDNTTLHFDSFTTTADLVLNLGASGWTNEKHMIVVNNNGTSSAAYAFQDVYSEATAPATLASQYGVWYDTTNNLIRRTTDTGSTWTSTPYSFPICIAINTGGTCDGVFQVFNGLGFIGNVFFTLPGVKCLLPNGRNEDGSLKNTLIETNVVATRTAGPTATPSGMTLTYTPENPTIQGCATDTSSVKYVYDEDSNIYYPTDHLPDRLKRIKLARCFCNGTRIISMTPNYAFHAVDYSDKEYIAYQAMPSDKYTDFTPGATGTTYTAPADGYVHVRTGTSTNEGGYLTINTDLISQGLDISRTGYGKETIPVRRGQNFSVEYGGNSLTLVRFIYANGAV